MLNLSKKLRTESQSQTTANNNNNLGTQKISIRDRLLVKEVQELDATLPPTCKVNFPDPNLFHEFTLTVSPEDGYWRNGTFEFSIFVTEDYNFAPPIVKCKTKLWHPNINEDGGVCLSLLRQSSIDELGWAPTRRLKDVIWGLDSLFTDLLNFEDPLNIEAAEEYQKDPKQFEAKVKEYIRKHCPASSGDKDKKKGKETRSGNSRVRD